MEEFKKNCFIKFTIKGKEYSGNYIRSVNANRCQVANDSGTKFEIEKKYVTRNEPTVVSPEQLRRLWRYEISWQGLEKELDMSRPIDYDDYEVTFGDLRAALTRIKTERIANAKIKTEWYKPTSKTKKGTEYKGVHFEKSSGGVEVIEGLPDRSDILWDIYSELKRLRDDDSPVYELADEYISRMDSFVENEKKPISERNYSIEQKWNFVSRWHHYLDEADERVLDYYREFVNELCSSGDMEAMELKAEECAGGDEAFDCDWEYARKIYEMLFYKDGVKHSSDLGEIYYYGRCNNGIPEYDKAYRHFLIDSLGFKISESRIYLADMFYNGHGVPQNKPYAYYLLDSMCDELEDRIYGRTSGRGFDFITYDLLMYARISKIMGDYVNAGGVLGMHNYYWHDDGYVNDGLNPEKAYSLYLRAYSALTGCDPDDLSSYPGLAEKITDKLEALETSGSIKKREKTVEVNIGALLSDYRKGYSTIIMNAERLENGDMKLVYYLNKNTAEGFSRNWCIGITVPQEKGEPSETIKNEMPGMLITIPEAGFGGIVETLTLIVKDPVLSKNTDFLRPIEFDYVSGGSYYLRGKFVAAISGEYWFTNPVLKE